METPMPTDPRFAEAIRRFDEENDHDPHRIVVNGLNRGYEAVYSEWVTDWVRRLSPEPSEALLLAARCQHLCRWKIPRDSYERTRTGYLRWRTELKRFHAEKSGEILREAAYPVEIVAAVQDLNLKKNLGRDADCQILEDALCLVTLQHQLDDLIVKTERQTMVGILQKTWKKMSPVAREFAMGLHYSDEAKALLEEALS